MKYIKTFESFTALNEINFKTGDTLGGDGHYRILIDFLSSLDGDLIDTLDYDEPLTEKLIKQIYKAAPVIAKVDDYELLAMMHTGGRSEEIDVFLFDRSANSIAESFCGIIQLELNTYAKYVDIQKLFNLQAYTINWSNIAKRLQGAGLGKKMYTALYKWLTDQGACLQSDMNLYPGSAAIWTKYMPSIASWFGVNIAGVLLPIDKSEIDKTKFINNVDHLIAMENPPADIRKIGYNIQGLSFNAGEYGVVEFVGEINDDMEIVKQKEKKLDGVRMFADVIKECDDVQDFLFTVKYDVQNVLSATGRSNKFKAIICIFYNAIVILKDTKNGLVMVTI